MPREITRIEVPDPEPMHQTPDGGAETQGAAYRLSAPAVATEPLTVIAPDGTALTWVPTELCYRDENGRMDYIVGSAPANVRARDREARYQRTFPMADDVFLAEAERVKHWVILHEPPRPPAEYLSGAIEFGVTGIVSGVTLPEGRHATIEAGPFRLPKPVARDLAGREIEGYYEALAAEEGQQLFVWFPAANVLGATYPVMIDPTITTTTTIYGTHTLGAGIAQAPDGSWFLLVQTPSIAVYRSTDNGQTWSNTGFPSGQGGYGGTNAYSATICATTDGRVYVLWIDDADKRSIRYAYWSGTGWSQPALAQGYSYDIYNLAACAGPNGSIYAALTLEQQSRVITCLRYVNGSWTSTTVAQNTNADDVSIGVSGQTVVVAWQRTLDNINWSLYTAYSTNGGSTFSQSDTIANVRNTPPYLFLSDSGTLQLTYSTEDNKVALRSWAGTTWGAPVTISGVAPQWPRGVTAPSATVLVWVDYVGGWWQVQYTHNANGTWASPATLSPVSAYQRYPSVPQKATGSMIPVAWTEGDSSPYTIKSATIALNRPPNAPSLGVRSNFDATYAATFSWAFSDPDPGASQSAYQLLIKRASDGTTVYDTGKVVSSSQQHTVPGGTLQNGVQYRWTVRTWDQADAVGPYATEQSFLTSARPTVTITDPATDWATVATSEYTVQWSVSDPESKGQSAYRVVLKQGGTVVHDSGQVQSTSARAYTLTGLANNISYTIEVTAWDGDGVASQPAARTFSTQFTPPPAPSLTVEALDGRVRVTIANHNDGATIPAVSNDIYRRRAGETGNGVRIATGVAPDGVVEDYAVASGVAYEYRAVAVGGNGTTTASAWTPAPVLSLRGAWLHDPADPAGTVRSYRVAAQPERGEDWEPERALLQFAGRSLPVAEFGEHEDQQVHCTILILPGRMDDLNALRSLAARRSVVCYRDSAGRRIFGVLGQLRIRDERHGGYTVDLEITAVDYDEAV